MIGAQSPVDLRGFANFSCCRSRFTNVSHAYDWCCKLQLQSNSSDWNPDVIKVKRIILNEKKAYFFLILESILLMFSVLFSLFSSFASHILFIVLDLLHLGFSLSFSLIKIWPMPSYSDGTYWKKCYVHLCFPYLFLQLQQIVQNLIFRGNVVYMEVGGMYHSFWWTAEKRHTRAFSLLYIGMVCGSSFIYTILIGCYVAVFYCVHPSEYFDTKRLLLKLSFVV